MMRRTLGLAFILAAALLPLGRAGGGEEQPAPESKPEPAPPALRPNIVFILADDLGWGDTGFNGADYKTPHIDQIAAGGARFEQIYTQSMCSQTRAALMTGRYPLRYGLQTLVVPSTGKYGLAMDEYTLPQALKDAGYRTAIVGKWHIGHAKQDFWPNHRGFETRLGMNIGEIDYFKHKAHGVTDWFRGDKQVEEEGYSTTLLGNEAVKLIAEHDGKAPLFMYLAFNAPHAPYEAPKELEDRFKNIADPTRRTYAAMIASMDDEIGKVVGALKKKGMLENTLVVFQSDNGAAVNSMFTGEIDMSKITLPGRNGPYRDGKGTNYEGGTRVAGCVSWAGKIKPGLVVKGPVHVVDWMPTLVGLAGGKLDKSKPLDGMSVWHTISEGTPSPRAEVVYNVENFGAAVRQGDWKLVWKTAMPVRVELFNLADDPYEKTNVADAHPEIVKRLQDRANQLAKESVQSLLLGEVMGIAKPALFGSAPKFADSNEDGD